ncbi:MAG: phosphoglycerate dehydrogenase, partial [Acidobacteria bacterium]|nr:phosphoglycerate dehydrogenase [Acidobacteriota bacterium]
MRILITEDLPERAVQLLRDEGWTVDFLKDLGGRRLADVIEDYDAIIVRSGTRLTADLLQRARRLRVIGRPGAGVDNIDVEAATRQGIVVMNTPGQNSVAAAEHTLALILCALRHVYTACATLKEHRWERGPFIGRELAGKVVGLYGLGRVGRELARRLRALQARVQAYDPYVPPSIARELDVQMVDWDTLIRTSDVISLHAPLTEETRGIFH